MAVSCPWVRDSSASCRSGWTTCCATAVGTYCTTPQAPAAPENTGVGPRFPANTGRRNGAPGLAWNDATPTSNVRFACVSTAGDDAIVPELNVSHCTAI